MIPDRRELNFSGQMQFAHFSLPPQHTRRSGAAGLFLFLVFALLCHIYCFPDPLSGA